jgi:hypothetical protein
MNLTVPPQGHRSIIEAPVHAAGPQVIGQALAGRAELLMEEQKSQESSVSSRVGRQPLTGGGMIALGLIGAIEVARMTGRETGGSVRFWTVVGLLVAVILIGPLVGRARTGRWPRSTLWSTAAVVFLAACFLFFRWAALLGTASLLCSIVGLVHLRRPTSR